jgi:hypothetical protein
MCLRLVPRVGAPKRLQLLEERSCGCRPSNRCEGSALAHPGFIAFLPECSVRWGGTSATPQHSGAWAGALVASLRSHILRPGAVEYTRLCESCEVLRCRSPSTWVINVLVLPDSVGRFCGVHHWPVFRCPPRTRSRPLPANFSPMISLAIPRDCRVQLTSLELGSYSGVVYLGGLPIGAVRFQRRLGHEMKGVEEPRFVKFD